MAKPKKSSSKPRKKTQPKAAARPRRNAAKAPPLSADEVRSLLKPPSDYESTIRELARVWRLHGRTVRSGDMTPGRLEALLAKALKADAKEADLEAKLNERLRPLRDERLRTAATAWSATLNVWDIVKAVSDDHPEVADAFSNVRAALTNATKKKTAAVGGAPPEAGS